MKTVSATDHATHKVKITGIVIINIIQIILDVITNIFLSPFQSHGNHVQFCGWKSLTWCPIMMQVASGPYNVALYSHMFTFVAVAAPWLVTSYMKLKLHVADETYNVGIYDNFYIFCSCSSSMAGNLLHDDACSICY